MPVQLLNGCIGSCGGDGGMSLANSGYDEAPAGVDSCGLPSPSSPNSPGLSSKGKLVRQFSTFKESSRSIRDIFLTESENSSPYEEQVGVLLLL